jgi:hypothetical protein
MDSAWDTCTELELMLEELKDASPRKLRLFAVVCCRQIAPLLAGKQAVEALDVAEKYADGLVNDTQLAQARYRARRTTGGWDAVDAVINATSSSAWGAAIAAAEAAARAAGWASGDTDVDRAIRTAAVAQCDLLREIIANPYGALPPRPEAIAPLASEIYAGKWELMPLLGEWLQEHGHWQIGEHCLDPKRKHFKGCWVVDWVLERD